MFVRTITLLSLLAAAQMASGAVITYQNPSDPVIQQTDNNPCVIGGSCGTNGGLDYTQINGASTLPYLSPYYLVSDLLNFLGTSGFALGLDLNGNSTDQTITRVSLFVNPVDNNPGGDALVDEFNGNITTQPLGGQGNGYSDITFLGFTLDGLDPDHYVRFMLDMSVENAGFETLFLLGPDGTPIGSNSVPEPTSALMLGGALVGLGLWRRQRTRL